MDGKGKAPADGRHGPGTAAFSPIGEARRLVRTAQTAALATVDPVAGAPFVSLVTLATDPAGRPVLLLSDLAVHTRNIASDPRVSLLVDERGAGDPLAGVRVSLSGTIVRIGEAEREDVRRRFVARHEDAAYYCDFKDFAFYVVNVEQAHLVAGFGRIVDIDGADLATDCSGCTELIAAAAGAVEHMNEDHHDALQLYATRLLGVEPGDWRACGIDPEGIDMISGGRVCRLEFPHRVTGPGPLRAVLKELAAQARGAAS